MTAERKGNSSSVVWMGVSFVLLVLVIVLVRMVLQDETVARVNGVDIGKDQVYAYLMDYNGEEVLDKLIMEELILQEADKKGVVVTQDELDEAWHKMKDEFSSEEEFQESLKQDGYTEETLRHEVKIQLYIRKMLEPQIQVNEEDMTAYYTEHQSHFTDPEMVKVKHVLVESREQAEDLLAKIRQGSDFSKQMDKMIDGQSIKGGELDYFSRHTDHTHTEEHMGPAFEEAAFSLEKGELSDVVETTQGFHIILMVDRKPSSTRPYSEVKEEVREEIVSEKILNLTGPWFEELRSEADIKVFN